jgi:hypothetical protein
MDEKTRTTRIENLIRTYGADFDRWPATEGLGRPALDGHLKDVHAEEQALDAVIQRASVPAPSAALRARLLAIPAQAPAHRSAGFSWLLTGFWRPASVAVGALALGLFLGQLTLMQTAQTADQLAHATPESEAETLFAELVLGPSEGLTEFPQ